MRLRCRLLVFVIAVTLGPAASGAPAQLVGPELPVNVHTTSEQGQPKVAVDGSGGFVVTWQSRETALAPLEVLARRFGPDGDPLGGELTVNFDTPESDFQPAIAANAAGEFVVSWSQLESYYMISETHARFFSATGEPSPYQHILAYQTSTTLTSNATADGVGNFVLVWNDLEADRMAVFAQRFDSSGKGLSDSFQVNQHADSWAQYPDVAADESGNFVVVWSESLQQVWARRFDATGQPLGDDFRVDTTAPAAAIRPEVAMTAAGEFLVVWHGPAAPSPAIEVRGQFFDASGARVGPELSMNSYTPGPQGNASVAVTDTREFLVTWTSSGQDGSGRGIFGRRFDVSGNPIGPELRINTYTTSDQRSSNVAAGPGGVFVATWESEGQDGEGFGVFAQRLSVVVFRGDFETGDTCDWSASSGAGGCP